MGCSVAFSIGAFALIPELIDFVVVLNGCRQPRKEEVPVNFAKIPKPHASVLLMPALHSWQPWSSFIPK